MMKCYVQTQILVLNYYNKQQSERINRTEENNEVHAFPVRWALACVRVCAVHACSSVSTGMAHTVINVLFAIEAREACKEEMI